MTQYPPQNYRYGSQPAGRPGQNKTRNVVLGVLGLGAIGLLVFVVIVRPAQQSVEDDKSEVCRRNLDSISKACMMYANGNNDHYPPSIEFLIKDGSSPGLFKCPSCASSAATDYFLFCPKDAVSISSEGLLAAEFRSNHGEKRAVVTFNCRDTVMPEWVFLKELDKPCNKEFKEKFLAAGGQP